MVILRLIQHAFKIAIKAQIVPLILFTNPFVIKASAKAVKMTASALKT
jgi:hypothetical protein